MQAAQAIGMSSQPAADDPDRGTDADDGPADRRTDADERPESRAGDGTEDRDPGEYPLPPGPDGYPLIGDTLQFVRGPFEYFDTLAEYGDVVRYRVLGRTFTALLRPEHVERVLVEEPDRFERFLFADTGFDFAPEGLLFSHGEQWQNQRRLMQPAFTVERIRTYADTMAGYAADAADGWADGQELSLVPRYSELTLRILAKTLFDVEVDPDGEDEAITRAARLINDLGDSRSPTVFLPNWIPTPTRRRYNRTMRAYRERVNELIDERRASDGDGDDLLSILLNAEGPEGYTLSEKEVRDNLITFTFAGHETSSLGLTYTTMLLAQHDDVADQLRAELDAVLDGEQPRFEHVPQLEYTDRVVREALRLYPPAFAMWRKATEDAVVGGYRIPEGSLLTVPQFRLHEDPRYWDDPGQFDPDRWTDDRERERPDYAYFPFGGGPRHCIGMRFAMLEMKLVVATLLDRFELTLLSDPDPELSPGVTLQPDEPVRVRVHER